MVILTVWLLLLALILWLSVIHSLRSNIPNFCVLSVMVWRLKNEDHSTDIQCHVSGNIDWGKDILHFIYEPEGANCCKILIAVISCWFQIDVICVQEWMNYHSLAAFLFLYCHFELTQTYWAQFPRFTCPTIYLLKTDSIW